MNRVKLSGVFLFFIYFMFTTASSAMDYYVNASGNDSQDGLSPFTAWKSLQKVNSTQFRPGDKILFEGGSNFPGSIYLKQQVSGTGSFPITITSYGNGKAIIDGGTSYGIYCENNSGYSIRNLIIKGSGRTTNTNHGIIFYNKLSPNVRLSDIEISDIEVHGFLKSGIFIGASAAGSGYDNVLISRCNSFENGEAGISTWAPGKYAVKNMRVSHCKAYNNSGRKEITTTHTGNGILLGYVQEAVVEYCEAYNNGFLNGHKGGGPVGIWCYESDKVVIQYNHSHHNKAGDDADGGGFDIDGGTTNSFLQYNYSHDNEGAGYLFAQFYGASTMKNNAIRYNVSENDGLKNNYGGIVLWGGNSFSESFIYNNTIIVDAAKAIQGVPCCVTLLNSNFSGAKFYNNIFMAKGGADIIRSHASPGKSIAEFSGNLYYSPDRFIIKWGGITYPDLSSWINATAQETSAQGAITGLEADPELSGLLEGRTVSGQFCPGYDSPAIDRGVDILTAYGVNPGLFDFLGNNIPAGTGFDIGCIESPVITAIPPAVNSRAEISFFPNPVEKEFTIRMKNHQGEDLDYHILDAKGTIVFSGKIKEGSLSQIPDLEEGMYFITVFYNGNPLGSSKVIIGK